MIHITIEWPEVLAFFAGLIVHQFIKGWVDRRSAGKGKA